MKLPRRKVLRLAAGAVVLPAVSRVASAQTYPTRPVRIIVSAPPGGVTDIIARLIGQRLAERLGQPFIVENRPGGGTNIGTEAVVRSPPDGFTLLVCASPNAIKATLYDKLKFNFLRDVAPVAGLVRYPWVMEVNSLIPVKTVSEFIAYANSQPGKINMASAGIGLGSHVAGELFKFMTGIKMIHVPYRGDAPALTDLLGGQVQVYFGSVPSSIEYIKTGKLRALAVTTATRSEALPAVPTVGESLPGYEASAWLGIGVPRNTPRRNHRHAQQRDQCGSWQYGDPGSVRRPGRDRVSNLAWRVRQVHRCRHREMGQGGQVRGHQGGLIVARPPRASATRCCAALSFLTAWSLIAERPPHRSRRAPLTQRAPPLGRTSSDAQREAACDPAHSRQPDRRRNSAQCPNHGRLSAVSLG
jgi:tripartite-type tricarboxylate transporter receptor subunit TctC